MHDHTLRPAGPQLRIPYRLATLLTDQHVSGTQRRAFPLGVEALEIDQLERARDTGSRDSHGWKLLLPEGRSCNAQQRDGQEGTHRHA